MIHIAIKSCQRDIKNGANQAIRDTWLPLFPNSIEHKFYVGGTPRTRLADDEMYVNAGDGYGKGESNGYEHLPKKLLEILKDFLKTSEPFLFVCDTDVYIIPDLLLKSPFEKYDYSGVFSPIYPIGVRLESFKDNLGAIISPFYNYASSHSCFFSRKAVETAIRHFADTSNHWADDFMVGQTLGPFTVTGEIKTCNLDIENKAIFHMNNSSQKGGRVSPANWVYSTHELIMSGGNGCEL